MAFLARSKVSRNRLLGLLAVAGLAALALAQTPISRAGLAQQAAPRLERVAAGADRPTKELYRSSAPSLSADGQIVAFWSSASTLVANDTNNANDVFVVDRASGSVERVSVSASGGQASGASLSPALSADGRWVAFESRAANLVPSDSNSSSDVFVKDRQSGEIERVSVSSDGAQGNGASYRPVLSADGRFVAFWSEASTLVPDDINNSYDNGGYDVFLRDRQSGTTTRLSVSAEGEEAIADCVAPAISANGQLVAFGCYAPNLIPNDTNSVPDIFVKDVASGAIERQSLAADGAEANADSFWNPSISADGRFVAFWSEASNLVADDTNGTLDVFLRDRATGAVERISVGPAGEQANGPSYSPSVATDGQLVVFYSEATNLVPGDTNGVADVFLKDRSTGTLQLLSVGPGGAQGNASSYNPIISNDGRFIVFWSDASNLAAEDTNGKADIFIVDRTAQ